MCRYSEIDEDGCYLQAAELRSTMMVTGNKLQMCGERRETLVMCAFWPRHCTMAPGWLFLGTEFDLAGLAILRPKRDSALQQQQAATQGLPG